MKRGQCIHNKNQNTIKMPLDYRRFNGPEDSISYKRFTKGYLKSYDELHKELLDDKEVRKDGRALSEARSMCMFCMY